MSQRRICFSKTQEGSFYPFVSLFWVAMVSFFLTTKVQEGYFTKSHKGGTYPFVNSFVTSFGSFVVYFLFNHRDS
jgi:hypothetical protein